MHGASCLVNAGTIPEYRGDWEMTETSLGLTGESWVLGKKGDEERGGEGNDDCVKGDY
jgi:hypothetical protein